MARPIKYTDSAYLKIGDTVRIVESSLTEPSLVGKVGVLDYASPSGVWVHVRLENGDVVTVDKVKRADEELPARIRHRSSPLPRALVRFIYDFKAQHEDWTMEQLAQTFETKPGTLYTWFGHLRKDATGFPRYSERQADAWSQRYLSGKSAPTLAQETDDDIAVECIERTYTLTDGVLTIQATVKGRELSVSYNRCGPTDDRQPPESSALPSAYFLHLDTDQARSLAKLLDGVARLAERQYPAKEDHV